MTKRMLVNAAHEGEVRVAIVEDNILEELNVASANNQQLKGNIYKATVVTVEPGLQAAFVDYGADRNGFITFNDIHRRYYNKRVDEKRKGDRLLIQDALTPGAELLVQVYKEEVGHKGAALTTDITLPGRYLVMMPFSGSAGISRKIEGEALRKKLKEIIAKFDLPEDMGLIIRTAGQNQTKTELEKDYQQLLRSWGHTQAAFEQRKSNGLVYSEPDVVIRSVRDYFTPDIDEILVDNDEVLESVTGYFKSVASDAFDKVKRYNGKMPIFSNFGLEQQLEAISSHKVPLPSGGSIVVNPTEALTAIDVNSGKSRGQDTQEEMAYQTNVEAAEAAARQLRLRDVGGLIVIDFIDMHENKHRRGVERALKNALKRDKARSEVGRISRFGLLEMSRQRIKARLLSSTHVSCPMCQGSGFVMTPETSGLVMLRRLQELAVSAPNGARIRGNLPVAVALNLLNEHRSAISTLEQDFSVTIEIVPEIGALSTRDAFEIVKPGTTESQKDERRDKREKRDRRDRGRNRKRSTSNASNSNPKEGSHGRAESEDQPYEPPKVVGFLAPEDFVQSSEETLESTIIDESTNEASVADESGDEGGERRRRRRRRRRRKGDDQNLEQHGESLNADGAQAEVQESKPSESGDKASDAATRRAAARERNRARRERRRKAQLNREAEDAAVTENAEEEPPPGRGRGGRGGESAAQTRGTKPVAAKPVKAKNVEAKPVEAKTIQSSEKTKPADIKRAARSAASLMRKRLDRGASNPERVTPPAERVNEKEAAPEKVAKPKRAGNGAKSLASKLKAKAASRDAAPSEADTNSAKPAAKKARRTAAETKVKNASRAAASKLRSKLSGESESTDSKPAAKRTRGSTSTTKKAPAPKRTSTRGTKTTSPKVSAEKSPTPKPKAKRASATVTEEKKAKTTKKTTRASSAKAAMEKVEPKEAPKTRAKATTKAKTASTAKTKSVDATTIDAKAKKPAASRTRKTTSTSTESKTKSTTTAKSKATKTAAKTTAAKKTASKSGAEANTEQAKKTTRTTKRTAASKSKPAAKSSTRTAAAKVRSRAASKRSNSSESSESGDVPSPQEAAASIIATLSDDRA